MGPFVEAALRTDLPLHIRERVRLGKSGELASGFVLYWMRLALRGHQNAALDAAAHAANTMKVPLIVLLHLEDLYPFATARRQQFLLEGVRSAQAELSGRGIATIVQIDRKGHRPDTVTELSQAASLVVAEEPFCVPWMAGIERICGAASACPVWIVDSSSVVPSVLVPKQSCHRAYAFENATKKMHEERISHNWQDIDPPALPAPEDLLAASMDLRQADLSALVAEMDVDHSVKPVSHTSGGSTHGYARWAAWIAAGGLKTYAKRRNESLDVHGVSRMSAYLNAGMVSPLRLAREASAAKGAGVSKYMNEFLTWRGLSYAWCYHFPMPASGCTLSQLPSWASDTLRRHASDPRKVISRDKLADACSGDRAWDGMQRYLVETGELHNNARMGWGCAIPKWTASPDDALQTLLDLNNTFALDGHAPPSYGGLLGCLGLFTGPKGESAVYGKISARMPKSKYTDMPSRIPMLLAGIDTKSEHGNSAETIVSTRDEKPARQACLDSFGMKKHKSSSHEDDQSFQSPFQDSEQPPKRRWQIKATQQRAVLIELD